MNSKSFNPPQRAGRLNPLATTIKLAFSVAGLAVVMTLPALGTERTWTGAAGVNWSSPNNWSPAGTPQNGDDLEFLSGPVTTSINNDLQGLVVTSLTFGNQDYILSGNAITFLPGDLGQCGINNTGGEDRTVTINCALNFPQGGYADSGQGSDFSILGDQTIYLHLFGNINIGGELDLYDSSDSNGDEVNGGNTEVSGIISGTGDVVVANDDNCVLTFDGSNGNTFNGTLRISYNFNFGDGGDYVYFNKAQGLAAPHDIVVHAQAVLQLQHSDQIADSATVYLDSGMFFLNGYNETVNNLVLSNELGFLGPFTGAMVNTGGGTLSLNNGITAVLGLNLEPVIAGTLNLVNFETISVTGSTNPILDISATIEGAGFDKTGSGSLFLDGNNTFTGSLQIDAGTVLPTRAAALNTSGAGVILNGGNLELTNLAVSTVPLYANSTNGALITYDTCSWIGPVFLAPGATFNVLPADTTSTGKTMTFTGSITGGGGVTMLDSPSYNGTLVLAGSSANTFTGPLTVYGRLLTLDKLSGVKAYAGPLVVGGGSAAVSEARWASSLQNVDAAVTVYANGLVNLNNFNEDFGSLTFTGGEVESGTGTLELDGPVTVNPASVTALITGGLTLPAGNAVIFDVGQGSTPNGIDLQCNANISGTALDLIKEGAGVMSVAGTDNYQSTTAVQQGILAVDNSSALGTGTILVTSGGTLRFDVGATLSQNFEVEGDGASGNLGAIDLASNSVVTLNGNGRLDAETTFNIGLGGFLFMAGAISGNGPFTEAGPGAISLSGTSANTYTGGTFVNQGTLDLGKSGGVTAAPGNLSIGTITQFHKNGTTALVTYFQNNPVSGTNAIVNGGSLLNLNDQSQTFQSVNLNSGGSIHTESGTLTLNGGNGTTVVGVIPDSGGSVIAGNLLLPTGGNFTVNGYTGALLGSVPPELDVQAVISDTLAEFISKDGAGQMRFSAPNTFNSAVTVNAGTLTVVNSSGLGTTTFGASVNNGAVLALSNNVVIGKFLTLNSTNASGALQSLSGSNVLTGGISLTQTANISVNPGAGYLDVISAISGSGGLASGGIGTLQFYGTNANTYAGLTTIGSGVLEAARYALSVRRNIMTGVLTTNKISQTCIPGDIVIGSDAPGSLPAALQIDYLQQFRTTANIALHLSGSFNSVYLGAGQLQPAIETAQSLTGSGQVNLVLNSTLILGSSSPFTFYGSVNGDGSFAFNGPGTMTTWGNFNTTGGVAMGNGNWQFFGARHNGGIVVDGGTLAGDGTVDGTVAVYGVVSNATLAVQPHLPDPQGGTFHVGSISNGFSAILQLDMFGPSPAGGNDQIVTTSGGVLLASDTVLQTSFSYPPRAGDVIDLISVAGGQTITGNFANFSDGVMTLVGNTPVLPSYHGGAGHDFTLTVTNLALGYAGYTLAEGNGNQTVEPNECNLLYVSLANRRSNALTITNAYLRTINTNGVVVTVPVAIYPVIPAGQTTTNTTPFQFSTDTTLPCGGAVGFELVVGVVNEGQFAIDFSPVSGTDCSHPTGPCDSCTVTSGQFAVSTPTTTQPLSFAGAPSICYPPKAYPGTNPAPLINATPYLTHNFTNSTTNLLCVTAQLEFNCPAAPTNALGAAAYLGSFDPNNPGTGYLGDIGLGGPPYPPFAFQVPAGSNFTVVVMAQITNLPCNNYSLQLFGLPCPPPILAISNDVAPRTVRVHWSTAYPGFKAQQSGKLNSGTFSNVIQSPVILNSRYSITNIPVTTNQFYRLMK